MIANVDKKKPIIIPVEDESKENINLMLPCVEELFYVEKKTNKKTQTLVEIVKVPKGIVAQQKTTRTGGQIVQIMKATEFPNKDKRNKSIRDFDKNGVNQELNALAHDVSQSTVSNVLKKDKK